MTNLDESQKAAADNAGSTADVRSKARDWRNVHGQPDFAYLRALVEDGSIEALEKIKAIAQDLDIEFGPNTSPEELSERILATGDEGPQPTT